ncbi:SPOSA6832_02279 [Sporobolomyces salmonicolor]|uniref:chitin deacetylase n=1 Tax=Sporidiobolus salmonicolor TaxID=5005 RepID=A0A0D6EM16_SPOSA|nr:SPOSA6832_02279 [Sporobolomyces salmonicolor]
MRSSLVALALGIASVSACADEAHFQQIRKRAAERVNAAVSSSASAAVAPTAAAATVAAPTRTDEASAATITNPAQECAVYSYPPVAALQAQKVFPAIWEIADLSTAQPDVVALFNSLNGSIPDIAPRGTPAGNFTGVNYNGVEDPDCWWTWKQCTTPKAKGLQPDITKCDEPNTWGFTLDDGPNCSHNAYYDYLESVKQKATLFYIGSNVLDWPLEAQRGLADGHEICAHTWSHRYMTSLTNEEAFAELYFSKKAIKDVIGVTVQCWRPPYGDVDDRIRYIAQALGMITVIWEDNTFDYEIATLGAAQVEANYVLPSRADPRPSRAVLTHELNNDTMSMSEKYLPQIQKAFKYVAPVAVCNNNTQPYVETGYTYPNFAQWASGTTSISLAAPTAVSTDASLSIPLSTGASGSVTATVNYQTAAAASGSSSAVATGSKKTSSARRSAGLDGGVAGAVMAVLVGAVGAGAVAVLA